MRFATRVEQAYSASILVFIEWKTPPRFLATGGGDQQSRLARWACRFSTMTFSSGLRFAAFCERQMASCAISAAELIAIFAQRTRRWPTSNHSAGGYRVKVISQYCRRTLMQHTFSANRFHLVTKVRKEYYIEWRASSRRKMRQHAIALPRGLLSCRQYARRRKLLFTFATGPALTRMAQPGIATSIRHRKACSCSRVSASEFIHTAPHISKIEMRSTMPAVIGAFAFTWGTRSRRMGRTARRATI